jgi:hypothetical protein
MNGLDIVLKLKNITHYLKVSLHGLSKKTQHYHPIFVEHVCHSTPS